jgi:hypothetical protein
MKTKIAPTAQAQCASKSSAVSKTTNSRSPQQAQRANQTGELVNRRWIIEIAD